MNNSDWISASTRIMLLLASVFIVVAGLRAAQSILVPLFIAAFLSMICVPAVNFLTRKRIPIALVVPLVVLVLMTLLVTLGAVIGGSITDLTEALPKYQSRMDEMTQSVLDWIESHGIDLQALELGRAIDTGQILRTFGRGLSSLAAIASSSLLVFFTLIFLLFEASQLPLKIQVMMNRPDRKSSTYSQVSRQIQRYLALKTLISLITGLLITIWLTIIGVDFALVWGLLAFLLNFIPSVGSIIAAVPAVALTIIQLGLGPAVAVIIGYLVVNVTMGNFIEPRLMGQTLGLSTLVVFVSLIFWGWVWGTIGMLLSIPLTMVVKILLESNPQTRPLAILLSDEKSVKAELARQMQEKDASAEKAAAEPQ